MRSTARASSSRRRSARASMPPPSFGLRARSAGAGERPRTVVLIHGTSRADKLWPEASWIELGRRLADEGWAVALPQAGSDEGQRARAIAAAIGGDCTVWPALDLGAFIDRLAATGGAIGVDSGPSHIAVALGLPHVQLYNFPTAWRTGPQPRHGGGLQVSVEGDPVPDGGGGVGGVEGRAERRPRRRRARADVAVTRRAAPARSRAPRYSLLLRAGRAALSAARAVARPARAALRAARSASASASIARADGAGRDLDARGLARRDARRGAADRRAARGAARRSPPADARHRDRPRRRAGAAARRRRAALAAVRHAGRGAPLPSRIRDRRSAC